MKSCNQSGCSENAAYRFTWPGRDESFICESHVDKLRAVAEMMGMHLQVIALSEENTNSQPTTEPTK